MEKLQKALQDIYDELELAKKANGLGALRASTQYINNAQSSLMEITEELNIEITI